QSGPVHSGHRHLVLNANGGDDTISAGVGLAPLISLTIDGGAGNDTLTGGGGGDLLLGGEGDELVNGGRRNDVAFLGAGDDTFVWNPGDGSDTVSVRDSAEPDAPAPARETVSVTRHQVMPEIAGDEPCSAARWRRARRR